MVLARNEDVFLGQALANVAAFCDEFLLFDHGSRDGTWEIMQSFASRHPCVRARRIQHPSESHMELVKRAGEALWVLGVDGDEIYDPERLRKLRPRLLDGEFEEWWMVMGHCLHAAKVDRAEGMATGWLAPPSRSVTKLYNFAAIEAWPGPSVERLHGGRPIFRRGWHAARKRKLQEETSWQESPLRCLHACFCRRSSLDRGNSPGRRNIAETYGKILPVWLLRRLPSLWKRAKYRRGRQVSVAISDFFS